MHLSRKHLAYFQSMCTVQTNFDVTIGQLQNKGYFQGVYCNTTDHCFHTTCGVAIHTVNFLEIMCILQPGKTLKRNYLFVLPKLRLKEELWWNLT